MTSTTSLLNRRLALGSAGLGLAAAALGTRPAVAQTTDLSNHPLAGTWLAMANPPLPDDPQFPVPSLFAADGTVLLLFPITQRGPQGMVYGSAMVGVWEPESDQRGHFTAVQSLSDADGVFLGTVTVDGHPEVSADGQTFIDDNSRVTVTMRDAAGAVINQIMPTGSPVGRPVTAVRMGVGLPGFPEDAEAAATPAS